MAREKVASNHPSTIKPLRKIQIMVVDDDNTSLSIVSAMLQKCNEQDNMNIKLVVFSFNNPLDALATLRSRRGEFDLVVTDLHMPEMSGMDLQKHVDDEFKIPVIIMSSDDKENVVLESLEDGAVFYLVKPVTKNDLKNVWQYAVTAQKGKSIVVDTNDNDKGDGETSSSKSNKISFDNEGLNSASSVNEDKTKINKDDSTKKVIGRKRPKDDDNNDEEEEDEDNNPSAPKKAKVVWTNSLHNRFLQAISHIGLDKAVPKKILEFMNIPGLTRENVASHLQKYRLFLKRVRERVMNPARNFSERPNRSNFTSSLNLDNLQPNYAQTRQFEAQLSQPTFHPGSGWSSIGLSSSSSTLPHLRQVPYGHQVSSTDFGSNSTQGLSHLSGSNSSTLNMPPYGSLRPFYKANQSRFGPESQGAANWPNRTMNTNFGSLVNGDSSFSIYQMETQDRLSRLSIGGCRLQRPNGIQTTNPVVAMGNIGSTSSLMNNSAPFHGSNNTNNNNYAGFLVTGDGSMFASGAQLQLNNSSIEMSGGIAPNNIGIIGNESNGVGNYLGQESSSPIDISSSSWLGRSTLLQHPNLPHVIEESASLLPVLLPNNLHMPNKVTIFTNMVDPKKFGGEHDLGALCDAFENNGKVHLVPNQHPGVEKGDHLNASNFHNLSYLFGLDTPVIELLSSEIQASFNFNESVPWTEKAIIGQVQGGQVEVNASSSIIVNDHANQSSYSTFEQPQGNGELMDLEFGGLFLSGNNPPSRNLQSWRDEFMDSLLEDEPI